MSRWWALAGAALMLGAPSVATAAEPTDYAPVIAKLNRDIPKVMAAAHTEGLTIALVDGQRTVWTQGFGMANRATGAPVTPDTLFHIGSSSKTMTAALVMQLVEQGKVDLDAPLARYIPGFSLLPRFPDSVITVRSVIDLHSGIPGDIDNGIVTTRQNLGWTNWALGTLISQYPGQAANTAWAYSNTGYALLQLLVENVTGEPFDVYAREHLFGPAGMSRTTFNDGAIADDDWARPYAATFAPDGRSATVARRPREYFNGWGAGSVMSSANDMAAYLKTMIARGATPGGGRILQASTVHEMLTPQTDLPLDLMPSKQGLGWWLGDAQNAWMGRSAHWAGDTVNYTTFMRWLPDSGLGVFLSINTSSPVDVRASMGLEALGLMVTAKTGRTAPPLPAPARVVRVSRRVLEHAAGRYAGGNGVDVVRVHGRGLTWTASAQNKTAVTLTMLPRADGWYTPGRLPPGYPLGTVSIRPRTVAGRRVLMVRQPTGVWPQDGTAARGELVPAGYRIPRIWRSRVGRYRATNNLAFSYPGLMPTRARLVVDHGVLLWQIAKGTAWVSKVLAADSPDVAFTFGIDAYEVARGMGTGVTAAGDTLTVLTQTYQRVGR